MPLRFPVEWKVGYKGARGWISILSFETLLWTRFSFCLQLSVFFHGFIEPVEIRLDFRLHVYQCFRSYLKNSRSRSRAPLNSGIPLLIKKFNVLNKREPIRRRSNKRAMAGQAQKRSIRESM
jgi:hypothetical protein